MEKLIKSLVVLVLVAGAAIGAFVYLSNSNIGATDGDRAARTEKKTQPKKMRVEEKYGFTTEGLGP